MKPTQRTELFANIKKTFVSFFSILMFVALGVGVFLGITWAGPALENGADSMFREGRFHNFQVQYLYGLTDDDLKELGQVEGVTNVEGERQSFQVLQHDGANYTVKVQSLGREIDVPIVREGDLPGKTGEIAINAASAKNLGLGVGDTISFVHDADDGSATTTLASNADAATDSGNTGNTSGMKYLKSDTFKVTAIIDTADYAAKSAATYGYSNSPSGMVDAVAWVPDDSFDASTFQNGFPIVNIACDGLAGMGTFTDGYKNVSSDIESRITTVGKKLGTARFDSLYSQAKAKVEEAEKQLAEGKQKIADGEKQLADGKAELETRKAEGEQKLADGYQQLLYYEGLRAEAEPKLAAARAEVEEGEAVFAQVDAIIGGLKAAAANASAYAADQHQKLKNKEITQEQHDANLDAYGADVTAQLQHYADMVGITVPAIDHTNIDGVIAVANAIVDNFESFAVEYKGEFMTVAQARAKLDEGRAQLNAAQAEYDTRVAQLNDGWAAYYAGQDELNRLVAEGEQKIADGEKQLADAKAFVAENEPKVKAGREQFDAMQETAWAVLPRAYNAGVAEVSTFGGVTRNLSFSMAALFIIVGLLVSYFAVSRLVHEQVTQIGAKKALGFRTGEITKSFLWYSGIAVLVGAIVGTIVGYLLVEGIIGGVLAGMFAFGSYPPYFGWVLFIVMTALELLLILGTTFLACRRILKQHAVELLRGEKPPEGKERFYERWGIWDKLPLFVQTIVNNCINDKRRMLSTIVGVAGSTALIVTAITLNNDVMKSYDYQYGNVYGFNAIAYVKAEPESAGDDVKQALKDEGADATRVHLKSSLLELPGGGSSTMRIVVPSDEEEFDRLYHVNSLIGDPLDLSRDGVWVTQAYADHMGAKVGDVVTVDSGDGVKHELPILGFHEFWLTYHELVMSADCYQREFGKDPQMNALLVQMNGAPVADLRAAATKVDGFDSIIDDADYQYGNFATFSSVSSAVVAIYLVLAALMAVVVLLNLNVMFIEEKKRELIVLMINGFSVKDAKHYISYDSIVLTALGIIVGIVLGCIMGSVTVAAIEPSTGVFVKSVDLWAVIIGVVGSAALAVIMSVIALRRIPKFNLTDINKQ